MDDESQNCRGPEAVTLNVVQIIASRTCWPPGSSFNLWKNVNRIIRDIYVLIRGP